MMSPQNLVRRRVLVALGAFLSMGTLARGADFPSKPVTIVVPSPPGGSSDVLGRVVGAELSKRLGQPFIIKNMPGANGNIGSAFVAKSPPDGYTILSNYSGATVVNPSLYANMPYNQGKDLLPVAPIASMSYVVLVNPSLPVKNLAELIALAKREPGAIMYGTPGYGSGGHLVGSMINLQTGAELNHIPYQGSPQAVSDLLGGQIKVMFNIVGNTRQYVESGKLRALAVLTPNRDPSIPDVMTAAEAGYPNLLADAWNGLFVPSGTPKEIVALLNKEVNEILNQGDVRATLVKSGFYPMHQTPEEFRTMVDDQLVKYARIVKESGMRVDN